MNIGNEWAIGCTPEDVVELYSCSHDISADAARSIAAEVNRELGRELYRAMLRDKVEQAVERGEVTRRDPTIPTDWQGVRESFFKNACYYNPLTSTYVEHVRIDSGSIRDPDYDEINFYRITPRDFERALAELRAKKPEYAARRVSVRRFVDDMSKDFKTYLRQQDMFFGNWCNRFCADIAGGGWIRGGDDIVSFMEEVRHWTATTLDPPSPTELAKAAGDEELAEVTGPPAPDGVRAAALSVSEKASDAHANARDRANAPCR